MTYRYFKKLVTSITYKQNKKSSYIDNFIDRSTNIYIKINRKCSQQLHRSRIIYHKLSSTNVDLATKHKDNNNSIKFYNKRVYKRETTYQKQC